MTDIYSEKLGRSISSMTYDEALQVIAKSRARRRILKVRKAKAKKKSKGPTTKLTPKESLSRTVAGMSAAQKAELLKQLGG